MYVRFAVLQVSFTNGFKAMKRFDCRRLVYSSSATVYGAPKTIPIPETTPLAPESCYGRTKAMSEMIIKDVCDSAPTEWRAIALRYFNPAGAHPSGLIGEDPRGKPGNLLPLLAQMAVGKFAEDGLKIFGDDYPTHDGTCVVGPLLSFPRLVSFLNNSAITSTYDRWLRLPCR
jgi:UDP-glucose 4-epimerase